MTRKMERGEVVLAPDPYSDGRRPFIIVSDENYPFYPHGYLGCPITTKNKSSTYKLHEHDMEYVNEELHINPSYVNPWSPSQINKYSRTLIKMSDEFMDTIAENVGKAIGLRE